MLAQEESRLLGHNYIGTEHLLLGLIQEGQGVAAKALMALGISSDAVREEVVEATPPGVPYSGSPPFSPRAKKVLELSLREALQLGNNYIGTEHMLLGLVREGDGVGCQVLQILGADLTEVREQVIALWSGGYREEAGTQKAIDAELVEKADIPVGASTLFGWEDAAAIQQASLRVDARTERAEVDGVVYETCIYRSRTPPEIAVSVLGAKVTREAFDAYTQTCLVDAEEIEALGDAATYSRERGSLRVLSGSTMFVVRISSHPNPKHASIEAAHRVLSNLSPRQP